MPRYDEIEKPTPGLPGRAAICPPSSASRVAVRPESQGEALADRARQSRGNPSADVIRFDDVYPNPGGRATRVGRSSLDGPSLVRFAVFALRLAVVLRRLRLFEFDRSAWARRGDVGAYDNGG